MTIVLTGLLGRSILQTIRSEQIFCLSVPIEPKMTKLLWPTWLLKHKCSDELNKKFHIAYF